MKVIFEFAGGGRGEAGIVGEAAGFAVERADVDDVGADRALADREIPALRRRWSVGVVVAPASRGLPFC